MCSSPQNIAVVEMKEWKTSKPKINFSISSILARDCVSMPDEKREVDKQSSAAEDNSTAFPQEYRGMTRVMERDQTLACPQNNNLQIIQSIAKGRQLIQK